jgi:hypothetical protein
MSVEDGEVSVPRDTGEMTNTGIYKRRGAIGQRSKYDIVRQLQKGVV